MSIQILHGDIVYAKNSSTLVTHEDSYLVTENGTVQGIYPTLPEAFSGAPIADHGRGVIIPAFSDLHVHAPQYAQRALGMDCLLYDWLNSYTFPHEAKFADIEYAKPVYDAFVDDLVRQGTLHAAVFATIHRPATDYLFERMETRGLYGYVSKVNMDKDSPAYLCETTEESLAETERFLAEHTGRGTVRPLIAPRFAPSCTGGLITGLGELAARYHVGLHTHVVESRWEADTARQQFPDHLCDTEIYERAGLMEHGPSVMAHVIFPTEDDIRILNRHGAYAVHCPDATNNVIAGIMPLAMLQDKDVSVCLGSDVGGGHHLAVYRQIARAVQLSKLKSFYEPTVSGAVLFANAFYCATKVGGSAFGRVGSLEPGYRANMLVIDGVEDAWQPLTPAERVERFCYVGDDRNIVARYLNGKAL